MTVRQGAKPLYTNIITISSLLISALKIYSLKELPVLIRESLNRMHSVETTITTNSLPQLTKALLKSSTNPSVTISNKRIDTRRTKFSNISKMGSLQKMNSALKTVPSKTWTATSSVSVSVRAPTLS